ncbi:MULTISPECIES: peptide ABC transporter substrate-binding protein [Pacificimonas]|uniref:ABC transporter substrate-binding protein n=1 Tax=Pacificimonas aurantium TaxID=1250540 RepID=A0ABS7WH86_9SPHN|nr:MULTISPECIES: ABC transporter substrate-binding protein [Pacificimonas]MBZ6377769.1 ABC transporter substrate-binding protein [Pacificimonas aurantium]
MRRPFALALGLCLGLSLPACDLGAGDEAGDLLRVTHVADEGLDVAPRSDRERFAEAATHVGLTAYAPDGRIVPGLATSWRVLDDGRTYVFKLREAYWPDDRQILAGDVVAVLRRQVAPGGSSPWRRYLRDIEGAVAVAANRAPARMLRVDDPRPDTVTIELSQQNPNLLAILAQPSLAIIRSRDNPPPPSGAYVARYEDGELRALTPNPDYYGRDERDELETLLLEPETETEAAIAAFEADATDLVLGGSTGGLFRVRTDELAPALRLAESWGIYGYLARTAAPSPLADPRVRQALAMSIDRQTIIGGVFALSGMQPAFGPLPPTLPAAYAGAVPDWAVWTQADRIAEARRLLAEAGYGPETPLRIDAALPRGEAHRRLLAAIADQWAPLGIRVRGFRRSAAGHRQAIEDGEFDLAAVERISPVPVADYFLRPFRCEVRLGGFCDPDADALMSEADAALDLGTRIEKARRAARVLADDAPLIPVFSPVHWILVRPGITGVEANVPGMHPPRYLDDGR